MGGGAGGAAAVAELVAAVMTSASGLARRQRSRLSRSKAASPMRASWERARPAGTDDLRPGCGGRWSRRHPGLPADIRPPATSHAPWPSGHERCRSCSIPVIPAALGICHDFPQPGCRPAADRRVFHPHLRCAQIYARPRHDHRARQEPCGSRPCRGGKAAAEAAQASVSECEARRRTSWPATSPM